MNGMAVTRRHRIGEKSVRYAYAITTALLIGGTTATLFLQAPGNAQTAQNDPSVLSATATPPRPGAPMSFADLAATLQPAVVNISTKQKVQISQGGGNNPFAGTPFGDMFGEQFGGGDGGKPVTREGQSLGSGFIISPDGYIVTNNHVVAAEQLQGGKATVESITVILPDRTEYKATLVGRDPQSDIAVLKIDGKNLPFVHFGDSTRTRVGDWVMAIGNPFGLGGTVTAGIVSAIHRNTGQGGAYDRYIQTDASINQGNSGGPMFDLNGNVVGINSMIYSPSGGNVGIGFAIPAEVAKPIVETLKGGAKIKRGYLGIQIQPLDEGIAESQGLPKNHGEIVQSIVPGEAGDKAGIKSGDIVERVNGREVTPDETLSFIVANLPVGSRVPMDIIRSGKRQTIVAVLGERPSDEVIASRIGGKKGIGPEDDKASGDASKQSLGLALQSLTPEILGQLGVSNATLKGVVVGAVDPSSDAAAKGFQRGDILLSVNYQPTASPGAVSAAVSSAKTAGRSNVLLEVMPLGQKQSRYIAVKLREG
jgi:serine protease Do